jgi:hypothetical protein
MIAALFSFPGVQSMPMQFDQWFLWFQAEYKRRTGITWEEACGDVEIPRLYHQANTSPHNAVLAEIEHFDLIDVSQEPWASLA